MAFSRNRAKTFSEVLPVVSQQLGINRSLSLFDMEIKTGVRSDAIGI